MGIALKGKGKTGTVSRAEERRPRRASRRRNVATMGSKKTTSSKGKLKTFASRRTINPTSSGGHQHAGSTGEGGTFQSQDAARRLGGFETAGEHARTGNRGHQ